MRWCKLMQFAFFVAFTLSLANLIHNVSGGELLSQAVTVPARELAVRVRVGGASCEPDGDSAEMSDAEDY